MTPFKASKFSYLLLLLGLMVASSGCVHNRGDDDGPEPEEYRKSLAAAPHMLLESAEDHFEKGNLTMAHSQAERVYRMEPRNYQVLYLMARIALENRQPADAEQWAFKALESLEAQFYTERRRMWEFIALCRRELGETDSAEEALREARKLRRD